MISRLIRWFKSLGETIEYPGFVCGCCGQWTGRKFSIPARKSYGRWSVIVGLCDKCAKGGWTPGERSQFTVEVRQK